MQALLVAALLVGKPPVESVESLPRLLEEEFDLLEALDQLDEDRRDQQEELRINQTRRTQVIERRDRAATAHEASRARLEKERVRIRRRIRIYVGLQKIKQWQIAASSTDYSSWLRKRRLFAKLLEGDEDRIRRYHDVVRHYREARETHEKELAELETVEQRISDAASRVDRDKAIKIALLESVRTEKAFYIKAGKDRDRAARELQDQIETFEEWQGKRLWFRELEGQYLLPLPGGDVVRKYGKHTHSKFNTVTMHRGITLVPGAKRRKKVRVIYWGRVVFAGWLKGYGNTIIVDHTKNDFTLYAHLGRMDVKEGDLLKSRQPIGRIGSSGSLEGEKLYFELRIDGTPVNPKRWFR